MNTGKRQRRISPLSSDGRSISSTMFVTFGATFVLLSLSTVSCDAFQPGYRTVLPAMESSLGFVVSSSHSENGIRAVEGTKLRYRNGDEDMPMVYTQRDLHYLHQLVDEESRSTSDEVAMNEYLGYVEQRYSRLSRSTATMPDTAIDSRPTMMLLQGCSAAAVVAKGVSVLRIISQARFIVTAMLSNGKLTMASLAFLVVFQPLWRAVRQC